jgi:hypothetical protein
MSFRETNERHVVEPAEIGLRGAGASGEACGIAVATGGSRIKDVGGAGGAVWRSRREEWDRRHRRLWIRRLLFH